MNPSEIENVKQCIKLETKIYFHLNILYNAANSMIALWNKYQIFLYENLNFEVVTDMITSEFIIQNLILSNNYLLCLDCYGNVHITALKLKSHAQKRFKSSFQLRDQSTASCVPCNQDYVFCIKVDPSSYYLSLHRLTADFQICCKMAIINDDIPVLPLVMLQDKCILKCCAAPLVDYDYLSCKFNQPTTPRDNSSLVVISFDCMTVYGCLVSSRCTEDVVALSKLYSCPSIICDIQILENLSLELLISLKSGTVIRLSLKSGIQVPQIIHLNTAIYKIIAFENSLVYTDGVALWRTENTYSNEITFKQYFVNLPSGFIKFGDQIICVTFANLIYKLTIDDENVFVKLLNDCEYQPALKVLRKANELDAVSEEIVKSHELARKARVESNYIAAIALANRHEIMEDVVQYSVFTYENYKEVFSENNQILLTNKVSDYFEPEISLLLTRVVITEQHKLSNVFASLLDNLHLHIILYTDKRLLKTVSISITEVFKEIYILIPIEDRHVNITMSFKFIPGIPGALDKKQTNWIIMSQKEITLNSEHFIKTSKGNNVVILKKSLNDLNNLILKSAQKFHGMLFSFTDITNEIDNNDWNFYIKLPLNYPEKLCNKKNFEQFLNKFKTGCLVKCLSSEDFLKSHNHQVLLVGVYKVIVSIIADEFSGPLLRISCQNAQVGNSIRRFFSKILYGIYTCSECDGRFISQANYTIVEDIQRSLKVCLSENCEDEERLMILIEQFQRSVIGVLPL